MNQRPACPPPADRRSSPSPVARIAAATFAALVLLAPGSRAAEPPPPPEVDLKAMMERARQFTQPGPSHQLLSRFLGEWTTAVTVRTGGSEAPSAEPGTATGRWLMEGRWLVLESKGTMMGMPMHTFMLLGYDNFKMSYVTAHVNSFDTALTTSEGDVDPRTGALLAYGTLDEYLTGEHDKMVKYVWRFPDTDTLQLEVHDLPIGETNTQVVGVSYRRKK